MAHIFEARHFKIGPGGCPDKADEAQSAKRLGQYTSEREAQAAIGRRRSEEGFRDWPEGFRIEVMTLDPGLPVPADAPLARLYSVWHFCIGRDDEDDSDDPAQAATDLGRFSSERNAELAIAALRDDPRFRDFPDGFRIYSAPPDIDHWDGGFVSWDEA